MDGASPLAAILIDLVIAATLALAGSPVLAHLRSPPASEPGASAPYREDGSAPRDARRAPAAGGLVIASGVALVVIAPVALLVALLSTLTFSGPGDATPFVLDSLAALSCVTLGPALVVAGRRVRRGEPTTRPVAAAAAVQVHVLVAVGLFATLAEARTELAVGAGAGLVAAAGVGVAALIVGAGHAGDDPVSLALARRRLGLSSAYVAVLVTIGAVIALLLADEMGDRMTTRHEIETYVRLQPHALIGAALLFSAACADAAVAVRALRAPPASARSMGR